MKNLINALHDERAKNFREFTSELIKVRKHEQLKCYQYLLPRNKKLDSMTLKECKNYILNRKAKKSAKSADEELININEISKAGILTQVKISVEWNKSRIWGMNPTAEAWVQYFNDKGDYNSRYYKSGLISGCGYDKLSTAVADALNQSPEILRLLYTKKNRKPLESNRELLGYGSGYGILPKLESGVGVESHRKIFEGLGFKWSNIASGKTFDVYTIEKNKK